MVYFTACGISLFEHGVMGQTFHFDSLIDCSARYRRIFSSLWILSTHHLTRDLRLTTVGDHRFFLLTTFVNPSSSTSGTGFSFSLADGASPISTSSSSSISSESPLSQSVSSSSSSLSTL